MLLNGCIRSCTHASRSPGFLSIFLRCTFTYAIHTNISFYKLTKSAMYISGLSKRNSRLAGIFSINCLTVTNNIVSNTNAIPKGLDFNTNISTIKCKYQKESSLNLMKKPTDILTREQEFFFSYAKLCIKYFLRELKAHKFSTYYHLANLAQKG